MTEQLEMTESASPRGGSPRARDVAGGDESIATLLARTLEVSTEGLRLMLRETGALFAFTRRRCDDGSLRLEGSSLRYSAIAVLGGACLAESAQLRIFGGLTAREYAGRLVKGLADATDLGDTALTCWAAAESDADDSLAALEHLRRTGARASKIPTVSKAWELSALTACKDRCDVRQAAASACRCLLDIRNHQTGLFPHFSEPGGGPWYRSHVGSFADQVYPIQALSRYHRAFGANEALDAAVKCAKVLCDNQGPDGQWWWHYDVRTGGVIEGYPVYSVHQDSMAPMALLDLRDAGGADHTQAIRRGLAWLDCANEVECSLISAGDSVIWRKVGRAEPRKAVRSLRALASRTHPGFRLRALDHLCPPTRIDYECRPYHLAWVLYAWRGGT